jgi:hypothetical protein
MTTTATTAEGIRIQGGRAALSKSSRRSRGKDLLLDDVMAIRHFLTRVGQALQHSTETADFLVTIVPGLCRTGGLSLWGMARDTATRPVTSSSGSICITTISRGGWFARSWATSRASRHRSFSTLDAEPCRTSRRNRQLLDLASRSHSTVAQFTSGYPG